MNYSRAIFDIAAEVCSSAWHVATALAQLANDSQFDGTTSEQCALWRELGSDANHAAVAILTLSRTLARARQQCLELSVHVSLEPESHGARRG